MTTRAHTATALAVLVLTGPGLLTPVATADAGGSGATGGTAAGPGGATPPAAGPDAAPPQAAGRGGTAPQAAGSVAWLGRSVTVRGSLGPGVAQQPVVVERFSPGQGRWVNTARTRADDQGAFAVSWRASEAGHLAFRAHVESTRAGSANADSSAASSNVIANVTVYHAARATWYGPGSYGHKTACGEHMTRHLVGVASRTLPCGTLVEISYRGASLTVPVVDRGPFSRATWDLTYAAAQALGFTGSQQIGTLIVGRSHPALVAGSRG